MENNPIVRLARNPKSFRLAINAKCADCEGCTADRIEPGFRQRIRTCTITKCPLWPLRPYQDKDGDVAESEELIDEQEPHP